MSELEVKFEKPQYQFCHYCGASTEDATVTEDGLYCHHCNHMMWQNPTPVGGLIVAADDSGGVYTVRRKMNPAKDQLVLPAGFQTHTKLRQETWQQTAIRETLEEANIDCRRTNDEYGTRFVTHILTETGHHYSDDETLIIEPRLLVIGAYGSVPIVRQFEEDAEVSERVILHPNSEEQLGFSIHRKALAIYWESNGFRDHSVVI